MKIDELKYNDVQAKHTAPDPTDKHKYKKVLPFTLDDYEVRYNKSANGDINVTVWDGDVGVADMWLEPRKFAGLQVYQVSWVGTSHAYQGQDVGYQLYIGLISIMGVTIIQTTTHSTGARKLWLKLANETKIQVYGFDLRNGIVFHVAPNIKNSELRSTKRKIKLYNNYKTGMVLVKINSRADKLFSALEKASTIKLKGRDPNVFGVRSFKPLVDPKKNAFK
jgi:hypothetical protein